MLRNLFSYARPLVVMFSHRFFKTNQKVLLNFKNNNKKSMFKPLSAISLFGLLYNQENEDSIVLLIKRGILAQSRSQYDKAEDFFHEAIDAYDRLSKEKQDLNPVYRVNIYLYIANLYYEIREYDRSFRLFQECLRELIVKLNYERNSEAVIEISLKLSEIFAYGFNSIHDAKVGYEFCIQAILSRIKEYEAKEMTVDLEKALINSKILYLIILHNYGRYLLGLKENSQALSLLEQANILALHLFKQDKISNQQYGSLLNDLALGFYGKQNYEKTIETLNSALSYLEDELKNIEKYKTNSDFDYARAKYDLNEAKLVNLSNVCSSYFSLKDFKNAKENCNNALKLFNKNNFGENLVKNDLVKEIEEIKKLINEINKNLNI